MKKIEGICTLVAMPFDAHNQIDYGEMEGMLDYLLQTDIHGVGLYGVVSEFFKITDQERMKLAELFINKVKGSNKYGLVSVTDHSTEVAVERAKTYAKWGADCLMVLPPHFLKPPVEQINAHLCAVAAAVDIPVMIQYTPNETGQEIPPEELVDIRRKYPNIVYKIENTPPVEYSARVIALDPDAVILNGYWGLYLLDILEIGGKGVMPGCGYGEIYVRMYNDYLSGKKDEARALHKKLMGYITGRWNLEYERLIALEKEILKYRGIISNRGARHPAYELTEQDHRDLKDFLADFSDMLEPAKIAAAK